MAPKIPQLKPKDVSKSLEKLGFVHTRTRGSHYRMKGPNGEMVTIPIHNRPIFIGTLKSILSQANISIDQLLKNL